MSDQNSTPVEVAEALSRDAVKAMRDRFRAKLRATVDKALGDHAASTPQGRKSVLFNFAYRTAHARRKVTADTIGDMLHYNDDELRERTAFLKKAFPMHEAVSLTRKAQGQHGKRHTRMFNEGEWRRYYPMPAPRPEDLGHTAAEIIEWLEGQGYTEIDYIAGTCVDERKQTRKIGRLLPTEHAKQAFANDKDRQGGNLMIVISRHPYDLIRMSTGRAWESCMTRDGMYWDYVPKEVAEGSMVAYLVSKNDPEILDPMSRVGVKPLRNRKGKTIMMAGPTYGMGSNLFRKAVQVVMDREYNAGLHGDFKMPDTVYGDGENGNVRRPPPGLKQWNAEQWIEYLGLEVTTSPAGQKTIEGDLELDNYDLETLPDFSAYRVRGLLNLEGNKLTDLKGCPAEVTGAFYANNNALTTLAGAPEKIGDHAFIGGNQLTSLEHFPSMPTNKTLNARNNKLVTLQGCPRILDRLDVSGNQLTNLQGAPERVIDSLDLSSNQLRDLQGVPHVGASEGQAILRVNSNKLVSLQGLNGRLENASLEVALNPELASLDGCPQMLNGSLNAAGTGLTTLEGGPKRVTGSYSVKNSKVASLKGAPVKVGGRFDACSNPLTSLVGMPVDVGRGVYLREGKFTDLKGMPAELNSTLDVSRGAVTSLAGMSRRIGGDFLCTENPLTALEGMAEQIRGALRLDRCQLTTTRGMAKHVGSYLILDDNKLTELVDIPRSVRRAFSANRNRLRSTKGLPRFVDGYVSLEENPLVDATHMPEQCTEHIQLGRSHSIKHLPAGLSRDVAGIRLNGRTYRSRDLPDPHYPPLRVKEKQPATSTPSGDTFTRTPRA